MSSDPGSNPNSPIAPKLIPQMLSAVRSTLPQPLPHSAVVIQELIGPEPVVAKGHIADPSAPSPFANPHRNDISCLPSEVIAEIFYFSRNHSPHGTWLRRVIQLSSVCTAWHRIAVHHPRLWDVVDKCATPGGLDTLARILQRSGVKELQLALDITASTGWGALGPFDAAIPRISQLTLMSPMRRWAKLAVPFNTPLSALQRLKLDNVDLPSCLDGATFPRLRYLDIVGCSVPPNTWGTHLATLLSPTLERLAIVSPSTPLPTSLLLGFLSRMDALEELILQLCLSATSSLSSPPSALSFHTQLRFSSLRYVVLHDTNGINSLPVFRALRSSTSMEIHWNTNIANLPYLAANEFYAGFAHSFASTNWIATQIRVKLSLLHCRITTHYDDRPQSSPQLIATAADKTLLRPPAPSSGPVSSSTHPANSKPTLTLTLELAGNPQQSRDLSPPLALLLHTNLNSLHTVFASSSGSSGIGGCTGIGGIGAPCEPAPVHRRWAEALLHPGNPHLRTVCVDAAFAAALNLRDVRCAGLRAREDVPLQVPYPGLRRLVLMERPRWMEDFVAQLKVRKADGYALEVLSIPMRSGGIGSAGGGDTDEEVFLKIRECVGSLILRK